MRPRSLALLLLAPILTASTFVAALPVPPAAAAGTIDGPDVSSYQHPRGARIDWRAVARSGHEFAIVKATEGTSYVNGYFGRDYVGIRRAGMVRGSYHYARPRHPIAQSALAQARFYVRKIGSVTTGRTLPPALDLEETGGLSRLELIAWAQDFLLDVRALTGRTPMIYTYPWFWHYSIADAPAFRRYPLWMAAYRGTTPDAGTTLWQYTAGAKVRGIDGSVDMSRLFVDAATWAALSDGRTPTPWPARAPGRPVGVHTTPAVAGAVVSWRPPDAGSKPIDGYTVTIAPQDGSAPARSVRTSMLRTSMSFTDLTPDLPYAVTVTARNAVGAGTVAAPASPVVPQHPTSMSVTGTHVVAAGGTADSHAVLTRRDTGAPLAGVPVVVATRPHAGGRWTVRDTLVTDADGAVSRSFAPVHNVDVRYRYAGDVGLAPAEAVVTIHVRPVVTAALSAPTVRIKHVVTLAGALTPAAAGVTVLREAWAGGAWHVYARTRTGARGGYRFAIRPVRRATLHYRIVVPATTAHLRAQSATLTLRAR